METKTVMKKAGVPQQTETIVGEGQFDKNGEMMLPCKINGVMKMMPSSKVEKILENIKTKDIIDKKKNHSKRNGKNAKTSKPKVDVRFERNNVDDLNAFMKDIKKILKVDIEEVKVNNESIPIEHVVVHDDVRIGWISPRAGCRFGLYLFGSKGKEIVRIHDDKETKDAIEWMRNRIHEIDTTPKKAPKVKTSKKGVKKGAKKVASIDPKAMTVGLKERMSKCDVGHAISVPKGVLGSEKWFRELVQKEGWTVDLENRSISKSKVSA